MHAIYKISSLLYPERFYIGSAINFQKRRTDHLSRLDKNIHPNRKLQNHYNKYKDLIVSIIEEVKDSKILVEKEQFYIDKENPYFNLCKTAWSQFGMKRSEETKEKMRIKASRKRKPLSAECKANISKAMTGKKRGKYKTNEDRILL